MGLTGSDHGALAATDCSRAPYKLAYLLTFLSVVDFNVDYYLPDHPASAVNVADITMRRCGLLATVTVPTVATC